MRPRRHLTLHVTNHKYWNPTCESEEEKNNTPNKESNCSIRYSRNSKLPFPILFKLFLLFRCWSSPVNRHAPSIISQLGKPHRREEVSSRGAERGRRQRDAHGKAHRQRHRGVATLDIFSRNQQLSLISARPTQRGLPRHPLAFNCTLPPLLPLCARMYVCVRRSFLIASPPPRRGVEPSVTSHNYHDTTAVLLELGNSITTTGQVVLRPRTGNWKLQSDLRSFAKM